MGGHSTPHAHFHIPFRASTMAAVVLVALIALCNVGIVQAGGIPAPHRRDHLAKMVAHRRFHRGTARERRTASMLRRDCTNETYSLVDSFEGSTFFDNWDFFTQPDPTHGMVTYVSAAVAQSSRLAYIEQSGAAVMTVDTKTTLTSGAPRNSVRITSKKAYNGGLFIFDILRGPYGCAVWPGAWAFGPSWPEDGEIDVIEGVHNNNFNQMTLHTSPGCTLDTTKAATTATNTTAGGESCDVFTGSIISSNCDTSVNGNQGCAIKDLDTKSYGAGLNSAGGAVYAMLWNEEGIRIWFFTRSAVPADITGKVPDPASWGSPKAFWSSDTCATTFFTDLSLVFDITLGGDWAGATFTDAGCPGTVADYVANPAHFANANWAVNYVRVYQKA